MIGGILGGLLGGSVAVTDEGTKRTVTRQVHYYDDYKVRASKRSQTVNKAVRWLVLISGLSAVGYAGWNFYRMGISSQEITREFLRESNSAMYTSELPNLYWSAIEPYIKEALPSSLD